jgi:hypothetical protein
MARALVIFAFSSILLPFTVTARATTQVSGVTVTQHSIYAGTSAQGAIVYITPGVPNLESCSNTSGNMLWIDFSYATQPDGKSLYATLIAALAQNQTVTFGVSGCGDSGQLPIVYRIDVYP